MNNPINFEQAVSNISKNMTKDLVERRNAGDSEADKAIKLLMETPQQKKLREALSSMGMVDGWKHLVKIIESFEYPELRKLTEPDMNRKVFIEWENQEFMFEFHQLQQVMTVVREKDLAKDGVGLISTGNLVAIQTHERLGRDEDTPSPALVAYARFEVAKAFVEHVYSE